MRPRVIAEKCIGCGACAALCPAKIIIMKNGKAVITDPDKCDQRWGCIRVCPTGAFTKE